METLVSRHPQDVKWLSVTELAAYKNVSLKWPCTRDVRVKWLLTGACSFTDMH